MALTPGTRLGVYEITAQIGEGGMGAVYRGTDTTLSRQVAIKVLPDAFAHDAERLARFEREAKTLASLNHPNIAAIYGFEKSGGVHALVMELVEGDDLSQRIAQGAIPLDEALPIAKQIAEALEAAHEQGIIHRDLKPANIKVRADGTVKVLDFGLAKALDAPASGRQAPGPELTQSPTITSPAQMTGVGVILGTAAYMSPEQARGAPADKRADIWAFGAVLFEMLTGNRPFGGDTVSDTLAAVLRAEPDWTQLAADSPPGVRRLLRRCLEKNRKRRLQDIGDAWIELEDDSPAGDTRTPGPAVPSRSRAFALLRGGALLAAGAALSLAGTLVWSGGGAAPARPEVRRFLITEAIGVDIDEMTTAVISPDAGSIALTGSAGRSRAAFVHSLRDGTTRQIPGTTALAGSPIWSPDGSWLALSIGGMLSRLALDGRIQALSPVGSTAGGSWGHNGEILYSDNLQIVAISSTTGDRRVVLDAGQDSLLWGRAQALPAGDRFLTYKAFASRPEIYLASVDGSKPPVVIAASGALPAFVPPDHLLAVVESQLTHWGFDPVEGRVLGEPTILMSGLRLRSGTALVPFSASDNGVLVVFEDRHSAPTSLTWFDRKGTRSESLTLPRPCRNPELSPEGTRVAMECFELSGNRDVWLYDLARGAAQRFTTTPSDDADPVWSPDGGRVVFGSTQLGAADVFVKGAGGATRETLFLQTEGSTPTMAWSPDGKYIAVLSAGNFATLDAEAPKALAQFQSGSNARNYEPQFSPEGRFVSYGSSESGQAEVFVQPWPPTGEKLQVSVGGGTDARWNPAGDEIFYLSPDRKLMSVPLKITSGRLQPGTPVPLFQTRVAGPLGTGHRFPYAVSRDGQRFLMYVEEPGASPAITVILNWPSLLPE